ncbi:MAG TPA: roadblock/LC7 domain-containing protein [Desulfobacterales bacterium]|nr:roadblock/LC7 domain-containing protein [Desulfobacterales bacterium]
MKSDYDDNVLPAQCILSQEQLENIEAVLKHDLIGIGVRTVLLVDMSGNIVAKHDNGNCSDLNSLTALAAANCMSMDVLANIMGENGFRLHLLKGRNQNAHFSKINRRFLLITLFSEEVSLGLLRLQIGDDARKMKDIFNKTVKNAFFHLSFPLGFAGGTRAGLKKMHPAGA